MSDVPHPELARRFQQAIDSSTDVPPLNHNRLGWFVSKLEPEGVEVTVETVRKWLGGWSRPRHKAMTALAKILKVDEFWLSNGKTPEFSDRQQRQHNAIAGGVVNLVAGFIQMDGGHPAFPQSDDPAVHLFAIIRGAKYDLHVVPSLGPDGERYFIVPYEANKTIVLGVDRLDNFAVRVFELDLEKVEETGVRKGGGFQVPVEGDWKELKSFAERI